MHSRKTFLEALRALRDQEEAAEHGWVLLGMLRPDHHKAVESAVGQGLVELADRETRAELSVYEGGPVVWAARLTGHGRDALVYAEAGPAPDRRPDGRLTMRGWWSCAVRRWTQCACTCTSVPGCVYRRPTAWKRGCAARVSSAAGGFCT